MKIAIIGVGLIGGSFALAVKRRRLNVEVIGVDRNSNNLEKALSLGIIDKRRTLDEAINEADVIVLAIPVDSLVAMLPGILDQVKETQLVVDFGSTKQAICKCVEGHKNRKCLVAAHPMAGTEYSGPESAFATLYEDKIMILCEEKASGTPQLKLFREICKNLAMQVIRMEPDEHDLHIAYVSHLSHVTSFALSRTVLRKERDEKHIFSMAGSGFASTVRLAKSSPDMWLPIFKQNRKNLSGALQAYIEQLKDFQRILDSQEEESLYTFMKEANNIKPVLKGIKE